MTEQSGIGAGESTGKFNMFRERLPRGKTLAMSTAMRRQVWSGVAIGLCTSLVAACGGTEEANTVRELSMNDSMADRSQPETTRPRAQAALEPKSGSAVSGRAFLVERREDREDDIAFGIYVENATPGRHAVHLHEIGDCTAADASSAGDHWNPTEEAHGQWGLEQFHRGDVGNIEVTEDGRGTLEISSDEWELGGLNSGELIIGKAVVVHEHADDFVTQPDGNAGARVACGVIELVGVP